MNAEELFKHQSKIEKIIISTFLKRSDIFVEYILSGLTQSDFCGFETGAIFAKMIELDQAGRQINPETITQEIPALIREVELLMRIQLNEYGTDDFKKYIDELKNINKRLKVMSKSTELHDYAANHTPFETNNGLIKYLAEFSGNLVNEEVHDDGSVNMADCAEKLGNEILNRQGLAGIKTGFDKLDRYIGGLQPGHLIIIGARPSVGKTAFAMNLINNMDEHELPLFFSLEMDKQELMQRQLANYGNVDQMNYLTGILSDHERERSLLAIKKCQKQNIIVNDNSYLTLEDIVKEIRWLHHRKKITSAFIDHHDLLFSTKHQKDRRMEVSHCAVTLKNLAKELKIPIVLLSQLKRPGEALIHKRPSKFDLKESSALEQSANVVIMLHRELDSIEPVDRVMQKDEAELIIDKSRNGVTGIYLIKHNLKYNRFYEGNYGDGT